MNMTRELLEAALYGLRSQRAKIDGDIAAIESELAKDYSVSPAGNVKPITTGKRSPEARAKMAAAQKRRWAAFHKTNGASNPKLGGKPVLSAQAKANIAAATRKRWHDYRAAKKAS